ncbi:hypothetical protein [Haloarchaeobius sp. TZWWS8]|uniref:hypothetical protein n=1 Tax=Haloarchaeobius sp. TZWWS8 TaxID=3446121 RepID=UPI003EB85970
MIQTSRPNPDERPELAGLEVTESEWRLDTDRYRRFVEEAARQSLDDQPTAADCYRIGNRIEALIAEHRQRDDWSPSLVEEYPDVDSLDEIVGLARFFRHCHDCQLADRAG